MSAELKPCPFCGTQPTEYDQIGYSSVKCKPCNFSIKVKSMDGPPYAPELWNTRAELSALKGGGEAVGVVFTMQPCFPGEPKRAHAQLNRALPAGTKLYAEPVAPPASGAVPVHLRGLLERVTFSPSGRRHWDALKPDRLDATDELRALLAKGVV